MDIALFLEYLWVLFVLIGLGIILSADNALVIGMMVKHLPQDKRKKALFYGLPLAFIFRFGSRLLCHSLGLPYQQLAD
jgi:predicted tellurium resistance membrane protein TerC